MRITFLTGNKGKIQTAHDALSPFGISVANKKVNLPEIQSLDVEEVAKFSAKHGSNCLKSDVIVTDVGYYIKALNGFPGPLIKFINNTLTSDDILSLMRDHDDRSLEIRECLAYCRFGQEPVSFTSAQHGKIARKKAGSGSAIDNVLIMDGFNKTVGETPPEIMAAFWVKDLSHYKEFAQYFIRSMS